jgi:glycosyltransferase involved in cell wall biosynthesis
MPEHREPVTLAELLYPSEFLAKINHAPRTAGTLKIVHLCWMDVGGAGIAAYRLHRGLLAIGVDSTMLVLEKNHYDEALRILPSHYASGSTPADTTARSSDKVLAKNDRRWGLFLSKYPARPRDAELFTDILSDLKLHYVKEIQDADIINLHWVAGVIDYPTLPLALAEKPVVWTLHDMNPFTGGCHYAGCCARYTKACGLCPNLGSQVLQDISWHFHREKQNALAELNITVVTPSAWLGECSRQSSLFGSRTHHVIPYGLPTATFRPWSRSGARQIHGIPDDTFLVLFGAAALHIKRKGYTFLLEALNRLRERVPIDKIALGIYGVVSDTMPLPQGYRHYLFGPVLNEESLAQIYSLADVYVIPTIEDNLPNTVIEALACGLPVVGFKTGGVPDMIVHKHNGYLVAQGDIDGLIDGIQWARLLGETRGAISAVCRAEAVERYDLTVQAGRYAELYRELADRRSAAIESNRIGEAAALAGDTVAAIAAFDSASKLWPHLAAIHNNRGALQWQQGDSAGAIASLRKAQSINPDDRVSLLNLGDACKEQKILPDILPQLQSFCDRHPDDEEALKLLVESQDEALDAAILKGSGFNALYDNRDYRISVIVIIMHGTGFIRKIITDILNQTIGASIEIICIDAIRQIEDPQILSSMVDTHRNILYWRPAEPIKRFDALNIGIRLSKGDYCLAVMTGDSLAPDAAEKLTAVLDGSSQTAIVYGDTLLTDMPMQPFVVNNGSQRMTLSVCDAESLTKTYSVGPHPMWRRDVHSELGYLDTRLESEADQDLWIRICRRHMAVHLPIVTGQVWLNDAAPLRLPTSADQFALIRRKYRQYPFARVPQTDTLESRQNIDIMQRMQRFTAAVAQLVENGRLAEALDLYDTQRKSIPDCADLERFDKLMADLRRSRQR